MNRMVRLTKSHRLADFTLPRVSVALDELKSQGLGNRTLNQNRTTLTAWLN